MSIGECAIELREPQPILFVRRKTSGIAGTLGECYGMIGGVLAGKGLQPAGPPFARYYEIDETGADLEAGMAVPSATEGEGEVRAGELPGGEVAVIHYFGHFEQIREGHEALHAFLERNGRSPRGAPWECYVTDPGDEPDPAKWETVMYYPI